MSDAHAAIKRKFALFGRDNAIPASAPLPPPPAATAPNRKRGCCRLTLRLNSTALDSLKLLRIAPGRDVNAMCDEFISKAVAEKLAELEAEY